MHACLYRVMYVSVCMQNKTPVVPWINDLSLEFHVSPPESPSGHVSTQSYNMFH